MPHKNCNTGATDDYTCAAEHVHVALSRSVELDNPLYVVPVLQNNLPIIHTIALRVKNNNQL